MYKNCVKTYIILIMNKNKHQQLQEILSDRSTSVIRELTGYQQVTANWTIRTRTLPEHLIYYICDNHTSGLIYDDRIELAPGSMIWLLPGTPHSFSRIAGEKSPRLYHFRFKLANPELDEPREDWTLAHNLEDSEPLAAMYYQDIQTKPDDLNSRLKNILSLLLSNLHNYESGSGSDQPGYRLSRKDISKIIEYCRKHVRQRISPGELAEEIRLSEDYFSRQFKRTFGISARSWLVKKRIDAISEDLISSNKSISEVADDYGYSDIFFFSRQFKQVTGKSPRNWIKQQL